MAKTKFKYEKEYKKDPSICKRCGKKKESVCIGGLCDQCQKEVIQENTRKTPTIIMDEKEAKGMGLR